jgi:hypothetical protein
MREEISKWFNTRYSMALERRQSALEALVKYIDQFPNRRIRRKANKVRRDQQSQGTKKRRKKS